MMGVDEAVAVGAVGMEEVAVGQVVVAFSIWRCIVLEPVGLKLQTAACSLRRIKRRLPEVPGDCRLESRLKGESIHPDSSKL